jgi:hypothetical protein
MLGNGHEGAPEVELVEGVVASDGTRVAELPSERSESVENTGEVANKISPSPIRYKIRALSKAGRFLKSIGIEPSANGIACWTHQKALEVKHEQKGRAHIRKNTRLVPAMTKCNCISYLKSQSRQCRRRRRTRPRIRKRVSELTERRTVRSFAIRS